MTDRQPPERIPADAVIVGSDLDDEDVRFHGRRLTERRARRVAVAARLEVGAVGPKRTAGRPSLSEPGVHSPRVTVRVAPELKQALVRIAEDEGTQLSDVARAALEDYARSHGGPRA